MSALPLSLLLEEGVQNKRHRIPYMTFRKNSYPTPTGINRGEDVTASSDKSTITNSISGDNDQSESIGLTVEDPFFLHLLSGETRLPSHPLVRGYAAADEEYETYVGEEDWKNSAEAEEEVSLPAVPAFHHAIDWITSALEYLSSVEPDHQPHLSVPPAPQSVDTSATGDISIPCYRGAGSYEVVLAGKYSVADDCPWAVSSRCAALRCTKDVVIVMQSSTKFAMDLQRQRREVLDGKSTSLEFSLIRCMGRGGADEWRVFIPYRLQTITPQSSIGLPASEENTNTRRENNHTQKLKPQYLVNLSAASESTASAAAASSRGVLIPQLRYTAVSQRATDVCYPGIVAWGEKDHHEHHQLLVRRVLQADLLNRFHSSPTTTRASLPTHSTEASDSSVPVGNSALVTLLDSLLAGMNDKYRQKEQQEQQEPKQESLTGQATSAAPCDGDGGQHRSLKGLPFFTLENVILVFAVDVIWSSATLPIYLLSGQVQLFAARPCGSLELPEQGALESGDGGTSPSSPVPLLSSDSTAIPPWIWTVEEEEESEVEAPLRPAVEKEKSIEENGRGHHQPTDESPAATRTRSGKRVSGADICTLPLEDQQLAGGAGFWRLLRSSYHWNQYVKNVTEKWTSPSGGGVSASLNEKNREDKEDNNNNNNSNSNVESTSASPYSSFCIIASEAGDLLTASERKDPCRSGLPLELLQPELLEGNPEAMAFFQRWRAQLEEEQRRNMGGTEGK